MRVLGKWGESTYIRRWVDVKIPGGTNSMVEEVEKVQHEISRSGGDLLLRPRMPFVFGHRYIGFPHWDSVSHILIWQDGPP